MTRTANVPSELRRGPFTLDEAKAAGVSGSALRARPWRRLGKAMYSWEGAPSDPWLLIAAWARALGPDATFGGYTAAWMHGIECDPASPVEVIAQPDSAVRSFRGVAIRHCDLRLEEIVYLRDFQATSVLRTLRDICLLRPAVEALIALDMALRSGLTDRTALVRCADESAGAAGSARLRKLAPIAEPAESPMETRLRWLLRSAGLPRPDVQADLCDLIGEFIGRADLYYPSARLVVEFDGGNHRERLTSDDRRQNLLVNAGFSVLRFTSADLHTRPQVVVAQVRGALANRPHSKRFVHLEPNDAARVARFAQNRR